MTTDRWKEREEERRRYEGDVTYDVWRSGGNPHAISRDRVSDYWYDGLSADEAARRELEHQKPEPESERESNDE